MRFCIQLKNKMFFLENSAKIREKFGMRKNIMEKSDQNTKAAPTDSAIQMFSRAISSLNLAGVILDYWTDMGMPADEVKQLGELREDLHTLAAQKMRNITPQSVTAEDRICSLAEHLALEYAAQRSSVSPLYELLSLWESTAALASLLANEDPDAIKDPDTLAYDFVSIEKALRAMIRRYAFLLDSAAAASFHDAVIDACDRLKTFEDKRIDPRSVDRYDPKIGGTDWEFSPDDQPAA